MHVNSEVSFQLSEYMRHVKCLIYKITCNFFRVDNTPDSFFNPYGKIPELKYHLQVYCTCTAEETATEPPKYTCINSNEMKKCRTLEISKSVFKASCLASNYRTKRDVGDESESQAEDFDNRPPMFPTMVEPDEDHVGSDVSHKLINTTFKKN